MSKLCLTLTAETIEENIALANKYKDECNLVELRADCLRDDQIALIADFPSRITQPSILTVRRVRDGGKYNGTDQERLPYFKYADSFAYIDVEDDNESSEIEEIARNTTARVIRSCHIFTPTSGSIAAQIDKQLKAENEIPKLAFMPESLKSITELYNTVKALPKGERIICAMGKFGAITRILPARFGSILSYTSPIELLDGMPPIGHIDPIRLTSVFGFHSITEKTALAGVTGWPLDVTASPDVHRVFYDRDKLDAVKLPLPSENIGDAIELVQAMKLKGLAVTIPHKQALLDEIDYLDETAKSIEAANTLYFKDGKKYGTNTDSPGIAKSLTDFLGKTTLQEERVAILGAGGAAKGVVHAVKSLKAADVTVYARRIEAAREIADKYGYKYALLSELTSERRPTLIIQCTSVGLGTDDPTQNPVPNYEFNGTEALYDIIYKPAITPIMAKAQAAGCKTQNGMSMLINQAEKQHQLFFR